MKFSIKDFFSKCDQILIFCAVSESNYYIKQPQNSRKTYLSSIAS